MHSNVLHYEEARWRAKVVIIQSMVNMNGLKLMLPFLQLDPWKGFEIKSIQKVSVAQGCMGRF